MKTLYLSATCGHSGGSPAGGAPCLAAAPSLLLQSGPKPESGGLTGEWLPGLILVVVLVIGAAIWHRKRGN